MVTTKHKPTLQIIKLFDGYAHTWYEVEIDNPLAWPSDNDLINLCAGIPAGEPNIGGLVVPGINLNIRRVKVHTD